MRLKERHLGLLAQANSKGFRFTEPFTQRVSCGHGLIFGSKALDVTVAFSAHNGRVLRFIALRYNNDPGM